MKFLNKCLVTSISFLMGLLMACDDGPKEPPMSNGSGNISGIILDDQGTAYRNIEVRLEKAGTILESGVTDENGSYQLDQVEIGNYQIRMVPPLGGKVTGVNPIGIVIASGVNEEQDFVFSLAPVAGTLVLGATDPLNEVTDKDGQVPTDNEDLLYTPLVFEQPLGELYPILAPDGHHISLNEWQNAKGKAIVSCDGSITKYDLEFTGLIPNGVYTIWNFILTKHLEPTNGINFASDISANGALGSGDANKIVASSDGKAELVVSVQPGAMSMFGSQPPCAITNSEGFILVVNYHIDGKTHGGTPGPDKDDVAHLLIYF